MLVLAGPGSGKTTVISERVRYLIENRGVRPEQILTITFTKAAAMEMQSRCRQICPRADDAVFGTFHSVFYQILRKSEKYQNYSIMNEKEKREIMKRLIPQGNMTSLQHTYTCEMMLKKISFYKNRAEETQSVEEREIMHRYDRLCREMQKLDFDDMLLLCKKMLEEMPDEREKWQRRFRYLLVDEFQDVNKCQYEVIKLLTQLHGNLFAVGDDDQAIYSFRGSDPGIMHQFVMDFPRCRQVYLSENYRCAKIVAELAGRSIRHNRNRFDKQIQAVGKAEGMVRIRRFLTKEEEAEALAEEIIGVLRSANEEKTDSIAVLVRTNAQAQYLAERFYQKKIPCFVREKRRCFYAGQRVQDILAGLRFAVGGQNRTDFFAFMNKPFRGLERAFFVGEKVNLEECALRAEHMRNTDGAKELRGLERFLTLMRRMDAYGAVKLMMTGMRYREYALTSAGDNKEMREMIEEELEELLQRAKLFESPLEFLKYVDTYTEQFEKQCECNEKKPEMRNDKRIQIMTYHAAKGLEFDCVFLPMLREGVVPKGRMLTETQTEEERRMFYVAMTRAKHQLFLSWHGKEGGEASLFLKELEIAEIRS